MTKLKVDNTPILMKTRTGEDRQRFSKLNGVFLEDGKLVCRNFPSQRILAAWLSANGWDDPDRVGQYVIVRGKFMDRLKYTGASFLTITAESVGVEPEAPKPTLTPGETPCAEADAEDIMESLGDLSQGDLGDGDIVI